MTTLVCADLDRTLIYSAAALALPVPDEEAPRLLCVEIFRGAPLSFVTEAASAQLRELVRETVFVPCTTRTPKQYRRVRLPVPRPAYAITANGGRLLVDGAVDDDWSAHVRQRLAGSVEPAEVRAQLHGDFVHRVRTASDLFVYAVVDREEMPESWVTELRGWCTERGWSVSVQGRKLYCVPDGLTKSAAAEEVARREGASRMVAAGDSLLDADLLQAADVAIHPAHGELHDSGFTAPGVVTTRASGILAGEEILSWLRAA